MKILVRGANWIGDAVMTVPALSALRGSFPDARIVLHSRSAPAGVFAEADFIDDLILIEGDRSPVGGILSQARQLRSHKFDLGIVLTNSFESALAQRLAGIPRRFGYAAEGRARLLTGRVPVPEWKNNRHEVYYYINLIEAVEKQVLGTNTINSFEPGPFRLSVSETRRSAARQMFQENGVDTTKPVVALGVGSTNSRAKRWPDSSFAVVADRIADSFGTAILVGSEGDKLVALSVIEQSFSKPVEICGRTTVAEAAAMLSEVDLVISNDMGLAHLAPAVGTPTLVIFGPTNDVTTRPFSEISTIISSRVECSPCMLRDCPIDHRCMTRVTPDQVYEKAMELVNLK